MQSRGSAESPPRFSVVIPAFNEERFLPRVLDSIDAARADCAVGRDAVEVIVADNSSTDRTAEVAACRGARVVPVSKRIIGAARNAGARAARGETLLFVDADTVAIHPRTFHVIDALLTSPMVVGGASGVRLERWSAGIAATYVALVPFVWLTGLDTGVVFCRREDFLTIGGYDESRAYAEDLAFLLALRRLGRRRGQRLVRATAVKAVASTRKFDEFGDWHYLLTMPGLALRLALRRDSMSAWARRYWYEPRR